MGVFHDVLHCQRYHTWLLIRKLYVSSLVHLGNFQQAIDAQREDRSVDTDKDRNGGKF